MAGKVPHRYNGAVFIPDLQKYKMSQIAQYRIMYHIPIKSVFNQFFFLIVLQCGYACPRAFIGSAATPYVPLLSTALHLLFFSSSSINSFDHEDISATKSQI